MRRIAATLAFFAFVAPAGASIIYSNGLPSTAFGGFALGTGLIAADDFILDEAAQITSITYLTGTGDQIFPVKWAIWDHQEPPPSLGIPSPHDVLFSGIAIPSVDGLAYGGRLQTLMLEVPITLDAGTHYWLSFESGGTWFSSSSLPGSLFPSDAKPEGYMAAVGAWTNTTGLTRNVWFTLQAVDVPEPGSFSLLLSAGIFWSISRRILQSCMRVGRTD